MVFFIGLVLALVCAWLICQFIRKFGKRFFTRFIPKFCKVMMWTTLVLCILAVGFVTYAYVEVYVCEKEFLVKTHTLPSEFIPQLREHGIKKVWLKWLNGMPYEEQEAIAKKQFLEEYDEISLRPEPRGFWGKVFYNLKFELFLYKSEKKGYL